jgi:hypothetical protein
MFFLEVDVIHFSAVGTFLDISSTIAKVSGDLGFRERFETVVTDFCGLLGHQFKRVSNIFFNFTFYIRNVKQYAGYLKELVFIICSFI